MEFKGQKVTVKHYADEGFDVLLGDRVALGVAVYNFDYDPSPDAAALANLVVGFLSAPGTEGHSHNGGHPGYDSE